MLSLVLAAVVAAPPAPAAPASNEKAFKELLARAKVTYTAPSGFKEVPIEKNGAMSYEFAVRDPQKTLEIRIAVRLPSPPPPPDKPGTRSVRIPDENVFPGLVQATMLNLSNGEASQAPKAFSPTAVKNEFNADSGFTSFVESKAAGWNSFKNCMLYAVRKAGAAEVYVFFLFDDFPTVEGAVRNAFHVVKFN
ncbi:MAG: hypothetical protein JNM17_11860 [Archangium sp.]|nr:hypothetical protein [Archangium sp.]